tara:strand:+ start:1005 stop:1778 length:774 start_codon:yes stop_codon:yes gene_type:complete
MNFIDTHAHLYSDKFQDDRHQVIENAINNGVTKILLPNISSQHTDSLMKLCKTYPKNCFPMMGVHPCDVNQKTIKKELIHVEEMIQKEKFIAVGEIGIDLYWDNSTLELQKEAFIFQIELAKKNNLPIVIHVRNSFSEVITIVEKLNDDNLRGVFHCFTGNAEESKRIINLGEFYLGIGGVLTFKNSGLDNTVKTINPKYLMLETDAPYLAPTPFRGQRNESKYIINIAKRLSEINRISMEEVAKITTNNALKLFKI